MQIQNQKNYLMLNKNRTFKKGPIFLHPILSTKKFCQQLQHLCHQLEV
jgi:hypothetical protein